MSHSDGRSGSGHCVADFQLRSQIDHVNRERFGVRIVQNVPPVAVRRRGVAQGDPRVGYGRKRRLVRKRQRAVLVFQRERHRAGQRRRQRAEAQSARHDLVIVRDGEKSVFLLVDLPLAEHVFRRQAVGGKIGADGFLIGEDFRQNERFGNPGGVKPVRSHFRLRFDVGQKRVRIDADGRLKIAFRSERVLLEGRVNFNPRVRRFVPRSVVREIIDIGDDPGVVQADF